MKQNHKNYGKHKKHYKKFRRRNKLEHYLDRYNHIMELMRTLLGLTAVILQIYIIMKLL